MTFIKAGSLTNLTDARYFSSFGVELYGFCFNPDDKNYLKPELAAEIKGWLHEPQIVGEFDGQTIAEIKLLNATFNFKYVQLSDRYKLKDIEQLDIPIILEVPVNENTTFSNLKTNLKRVHEHADILLLSFRKFGVQWKSIKRPKTLSIEGLKQAVDGYNIFVDIEASAKDIAELKEEISFSGYNLLGSYEEEVGLRNFENVDEIMALLKPEV